MEEGGAIAHEKSLDRKSFKIHQHAAGCATNIPVPPTITFPSKADWIDKTTPPRYWRTRTPIHRIPYQSWFFYQITVGEKYH
jgi:hypothetical protein